MKIQKIELTNYKAFLGTHTIKVGGKNVFIYGENGSGKSSLYYAMKDFFQSSSEDIDLEEVENAFVAEDKKGKTAIKITFKPNSTGQHHPKSYGFDSSTNDTRIAAIALSIYLGMIKRHIQGIPCKILFLDDVFIGLDIANRLPLLEILRTEFPDYRVFITTYDKPWFEYARSFIGSDWKTMEFYAQDCHDGTQIPLIIDDQDLLAKAKTHLQACDYKAAAVYTRSAFEKLIRNYCEKKGKSIRYKSRLKDYTTEDFWNALKSDLQQTTRDDIETYRSLVLNTFSHYNTEKHEIKTELQDAIQAVDTLKSELS